MDETFTERGDSIKTREIMYENMQIKFGRCVKLYFKN